MAYASLVWKDIFFLILGFIVFYKLNSVASGWRVCYQRGLPPSRFSTCCVTHLQHSVPIPCLASEAVW